MLALVNTKKETENRCIFFQWITRLAFSIGYYEPNIIFKTCKIMKKHQYKTEWIRDYSYVRYGSYVRVFAAKLTTVQKLLSKVNFCMYWVKCQYYSNYTQTLHFPHFCCSYHRRKIFDEHHCENTLGRRKRGEYFRVATANRCLSAIGQRHGTCGPITVHHETYAVGNLWSKISGCL